MRLHRSIKRQISKVKPDEVAFAAEDYIVAFRSYKNLLAGVTGMATPKRIKSLVQKIDKLEREIIKMEEKIEQMVEKRRIEAVKLQEELEYNLEVISQYLLPEEMEDFPKL